MHERRATRVYWVKAVAEMFDVSVATIYRAIETGQLNALKLGIGRGTIRVPQSALEAFARSCGQSADGQLRETEPAQSDAGDSQTPTAGEQS